ncbi:hypothetical protein FDECE_16555 [Fusarium decemcellulare]|nr:hypothetical protein FDECE_16555 [Fusarium decemcellulare]
MSSIVGAFPTDYSPGSTCNAITSETVVGVDFATSCLPDDFDPAPTAFFSPGTACPTGYTAQSSCTRSNDDNDQTTVTCCPERSDLTMWCVADPGTLSGPWESLFCTWSAGDQQTVVLVTTQVSGSESTMAVTMNGGEGINAYGLRMIYEPSDISSTAATTTDASTAEATVTDASATDSSTAGATRASDQPAETSSGGSGNTGGMGAGGIIAVAVVIPIVVIAALIGAFFWWRRRKNQRGAAVPTYDMPPELPPQHGMSELHGPQHVAQELHSNSAFVSELPGDTPMGMMSSVSSPGLSAGGYSKPGAVSPATSSAGISNDKTSPMMGYSTLDRSDGTSPGPR